MSKIIKLNLGCGDVILKDYINCDLHNSLANMKCDALKLSFDDNSVDEVLTSHLIEHFDFFEGIAALKEWFRVLKPGGKLIIECPDLLGTCKKFLASNEQDRVSFYPHFYGFPWFSGHAHKFGYTETQLRSTLGWAGFNNEKIKRVPIGPKYDIPMWKDTIMRLEAIKDEAKEPLVAVIIPCFNFEKFIKTTLDAVVSQKYKKWIVFVVNDFSTDNTANILNDYYLNDKERFVIINSNKNLGPSGARNLAVDEIKKNENIEYIAYCDSDDVWKENHLFESIKILKENKYDFVYFDVEITDMSENKYYSFGIPYFDNFDKENLKKSNFIYISTVVHKKECLCVGYFDSSLDSIEDYDFWYRMLVLNDFKAYHYCDKNVKYMIGDNKNMSFFGFNKQIMFKKKHNLS